MHDTTAEIDYSEVIEGVFRKLKFGCSFEFAVQGPAYTCYVFSPNPGTRVSSILKNADAITSEMPVEGVRIVAPIKELVALGVEVPNRNREIIGFEAMLHSLEESSFSLPVALGRTVEGYDYIIDLADAPHILVSWMEGAGKTMLLHATICSLICTKSSEELKFILAETEGTELSRYNGISYLDRPVISESEGVFVILEEAVREIERRIKLFSDSGARKLSDYNRISTDRLPFFVIMIDEIADAVGLDRRRFDVLIRRITSVARFCGIHLILTTAYPYPETITSAIRSNIPTSIALALPDQICSRIVIDHVGAEKLLGKGDMLYFKWNMHQPVRIQGIFVNSERELWRK